MLTLSNLKAFADDLNIIKIELDELIKIRYEEKLFQSSDDYYLALKACNYYPQDYFKIRMFDFNFSLRYNRKLNKFYIYQESVNPIDNSFYDIKEFIDTYKIKTQTTNDNYYFPENTPFENVLKMFGKFIIAFIKYYFSRDKLFSYEL